MDLSLKPKNKKAPSFSKKTVINPDKHWHILLTFFIAISLVIVALNAYLFIQVQNEQLFASVTEQQITKTKFDVEKLEDVIEIFEEKEERQQSLRNSLPVMIDPST